jgi:hypothetical protein
MGYQDRHSGLEDAVLLGGAYYLARQHDQSRNRPGRPPRIDPDHPYKGHTASGFRRGASCRGWRRRAMGTRPRALPMPVVLYAWRNDAGDRARDRLAGCGWPSRPLVLVPVLRVVTARYAGEGGPRAGRVRAMARPRRAGDLRPLRNEDGYGHGTSDISTSPLEFSTEQEAHEALRVMQLRYAPPGRWTVAKIDGHGNLYVATR